MVLVQAAQFRCDGSDIGDFDKLCGLYNVRHLRTSEGLRGICPSIKLAVDFALALTKHGFASRMFLVNAERLSSEEAEILGKKAEATYAGEYVFLVGCEEFKVGRHLSGFEEMPMGPVASDVSCAILVKSDEWAGKRAAALEAVGSNVSLDANAFYGRSEETGRIKAGLDQGAVVTLTGCGGIGKTRLAKEYALLHAKSGGAPIHFLSLLKFREYGSIQTQIGSFVSRVKSSDTGQRPLLIVDNCEHVLAAASECVDALHADYPEICVLATSRQSLGVDGEFVFRLPSLGMPDPKTTPLKDYPDFPAFQLLDERMLRRRGEGLRLDEVPVAFKLLILLDALPLAIEQVASKTDGMPLDACLEQLSDRFKLLTDESIEDRRHQAMETTIQWSYDLLPDAEKRVFAVSALFDSPFRPQDLAVVTGDSADVQHSAGLWQKSMMERESHSQFPWVFRLHESIKEFGRKFCKTGEAEQARLDGLSEEVVSGFFAESEGRKARYGAKDIQLLDTTVLSSLKRRAESGDERCYDMAFQFGRYLAKSTLKSEAMPLVEKVLRIPTTNETDRLHVLMTKGVLLWHLDSKERAYDTFRTLGEQAKAGGHRSIAAAAEANAGLLAMGFGDPRKAEAPLFSSLELFEEQGETNRYFSVASNILQFFFVTDQQTRGQRFAETRILPCLEDIPSVILPSLNLNLSDIYNVPGNEQQATGYLLDVLALSTDSPLNNDVAPAICRLSWIALKLGERRLAAFGYGMCREAFQVSRHTIARKRFFDDLSAEFEGCHEPEIAEETLKGSLVPAEERVVVSTAIFGVLSSHQSRGEPGGSGYLGP